MLFVLGQSLHDPWFSRILLGFEACIVDDRLVISKIVCVRQWDQLKTSRSLKSFFITLLFLWQHGTEPDLRVFSWNKLDNGNFVLLNHLPDQSV